MAPLTWLHLSDLHFREKDDPQQEAVRDALMRDVISKLPEALPPDMVLVTGNVAHGGKQAEYQRAEDFFEKVNHTLGLNPAEHWFVVPGEHDVNLDRLDFLGRKLRNMFTEEDVHEALQDPKIWAQCMARQQDFLEFTRRFHGRDRGWRAEEPWWVGEFEKGGVRTAFLCLNSAWCAQREDDRGNLLLGEVQLRQALKHAREGNADLTIALCRHSFEHLADFDRKSSEAVLLGPQGCQILLRSGEADLQLRESPDGSTLELASPGVHPGAKGGGTVLVGRLDPNTRELDIHVWRYNKERGGFWQKDAHLYPDMADGVWRGALPEDWLRNTVAETPPGGETPVETLIPIRYQRFLRNRYSYFEHNPVAGRVGFSLKACYVPLHTDWLEPEKREARKAAQKAKGEGSEGMFVGERIQVRRPLSELVGVTGHRRFVVSGDPGSGKSTFLRYTALSHLNEDGERLPLLLGLKDFGVWLADHQGKQGDLLSAWAGSVYGDQGLDQAALYARSGRGKLLWLLDGLDEIFDQAIRLRAAEIIGLWFAGRGEADHLLLTTRPHALDQEGILANLGSNEHQARVLPLDTNDQKLFLEKWFEVVYEEAPEQGETVRDDLWQALEHQPLLAPIRGNPLLLGTVATIYHQGNRLPERRADLYDKAVKILLTQRFGQRAGGSEEQVRRLEKGLEVVARKMFASGEVREVREADFLLSLAQGYGPEHEQDWQSLELLRLARRLGSHSGLLTMRGDPPVYSFTHLGFQEYLAAGAFFDDDQRLEHLEAHLDDGAWREVILLTAGRLFRSAPKGQGAAFLEELCARCCGDELVVPRLVLAMRAAVEAPPGNLPGILREKLIANAVRALETEAREDPEKYRVALGHALGRLGDPRLGMAKPERWVWVQPGNFEMGRKSKYPNEQPVHRVSFERGFYLGRFPVTNGEYAAFIDAGGYQDKRWWCNEGWAWRQLDDAAFKKCFDDLKQRYETIREEWRPYFKPGNRPLWWADARFNGSNQPVGGVSWFEAEAYCRWLTEQFRENPPVWWRPEFRVTLPSEAEWEFAARGTSGRTYPWSVGEPDGTRTNYDERLGLTSPVGIYPKGATPEGLLDMVGNVWEWCRDPWDPNAYTKRRHGAEDPFSEGDSDRRCMRGGTWHDDPRTLAAAFRNCLWARGRGPSIGFRCCVVAVPAE